MRQLYKARGALLAGLCTLGVSGIALAADDSAGQRDTQDPATEPRSEPPQAQKPQAQQQPQAQQYPQAQQQGQQQQGQQGMKPQGKQEGKQKALGAGIGGQGACEEKGGGENFTLGPLETGGAGAEKGYGAGIGPGEISEGGKGEQGKQGAAPIPQYWLADASLFVASAANAAQTLANEQTLGVQSPAVLGNQAEFLLSSTDRAISSLEALAANAESTNPKAVSDIRTAMDQLNAAKGQAQQARDAAKAGTLGPNHQSTIRSTYEHLQAAERDMATVGRHYGAQGFVLASACNYKGGKGLGVGVGGKVAPKATEKTEKPETPKAPEEGKTPAEKNAPPPAEKGGQP